MLRVVVTWLLTAVTLLVLRVLLTDVHVDSFAAALGASALIGLINALVWPLFLRLALPFAVVTLGIGVVIVNGLIVVLVSQVAVGLKVSGLGAGIVVELGHGEYRLSR